MWEGRVPAAVSYGPITVYRHLQPALLYYTRVAVGDMTVLLFSSSFTETGFTEESRSQLKSTNDFWTRIVSKPCLKGTAVFRLTALQYVQIGYRRDALERVSSSFTPAQNAGGYHQCLPAERWCWAPLNTPFVQYVGQSQCFRSGTLGYLAWLQIILLKEQPFSLKRVLDLCLAMKKWCFIEPTYSLFTGYCNPDQRAFCRWMINILWHFVVDDPALSKKGQLFVHLEALLASFLYAAIQG